MVNEKHAAFAQAWNDMAMHGVKKKLSMDAVYA
jgi:hypothetical protein